MPLGVDPRLSADSDGIFIVPKSALKKNTGCFAEYNIGHMKQSEGYKDTWYDALDQGENMTSYFFTTPAN